MMRIRETNAHSTGRARGVRDTLVLTYRRGNFQGADLQGTWFFDCCNQRGLKKLSKTVTYSGHQSDDGDAA